MKILCMIEKKNKAYFGNEVVKMCGKWVEKEEKITFLHFF